MLLNNGMIVLLPQSFMTVALPDQKTSGCYSPPTVSLSLPVTQYNYIHSIHGYLFCSQLRKYILVRTCL